MAEGQPFKLPTAGSNPADGTNGLQVLKEAYPALTRAGGVRFPGNPLYAQHSSVTTEECDKRRDMPVPHLPRKLSWDERRAEAAEGPVRLRGGAPYSRVAQLEAQRPLKSLVAGSTPAPGDQSGVGQWQAGGL